MPKSKSLINKWPYMGKYYLTLALLMVLAGGCFYAEGRVDESPNVILILADDMGYADLSPFGSTEIKTPHLTKLARSGCTFTNAYVTAPICVAFA